MPTLQAQLARQNQAADNQRLGEQVRMAREVDNASNMKLNQLQQQRAYEQQMQQQAQLEQQAMAEQAYATGVDTGARAMQGEMQRTGRRDGSGQGVRQGGGTMGISNPEVEQQVVQIASYLDDMVAQGASDDDIHEVINTIKDPELLNGLQEYQMARMQQAEQVQQAQANGQEVAVAPDPTPNLTEYARSVAIS